MKSTATRRINTNPGDTGASMTARVLKSPLLYIDGSLERGIEEFDQRLIQLPGRGTADAMGLLRIDDHAELLPGAFQGSGHLHGVLKEHVVILQVMENK